MFETGTNKWRKFDAWPPKDLARHSLYFHTDGKLEFFFQPPQPTLPQAGRGEGGGAEGGQRREFVQFISDPNKPVPYTEAITTGMSPNYMTDDQRFGSKRPDVAVYQTDTLQEDLTFAGPLTAKLWVSTSGTDCDWVVKLIDVFPPDTPGVGGGPVPKPLAGYQMMVRSEVIRGRFRNSYEKPQPFKPNEPSLVTLPLQDVLHTFQTGHRVMVQVCSTWFPLVDRNPQKYVDNIFRAEDKDFTVATQRVYFSPMYPSALEIGALKSSQK